MAGEVSIRLVGPDEDDDFLLSVYAETRAGDLGSLDLPLAETDMLIRMQYEAQSRHYRQCYGGASFSVILVGDERVGRLIVDRPGAEILIVDLVVLVRFRGRGIGGCLVRQLLVEADAGGLSVRCHVAVGNDAGRFWEHLGFVARSADEAYVAMERVCDHPRL